MQHATINKRVRFN